MKTAQVTLKTDSICQKGGIREEKKIKLKLKILKKELILKVELPFIFLFN